MTSFEFKTRRNDHGLKQKMIDKLGKSHQEALKLVHSDDIAMLDLTLGQKKLLLHTLAELNGAEKIPSWRDETNRNNACHYQDIGERWRFRRATEKNHKIEPPCATTSSKWPPPINHHQFKI